MNQLIPVGQQRQLSAPLTQRTEIVASTLATLEQAETMAFFRTYPELFRLCVQKHYPLKASQIDRFANKLNWEILSSNYSISWSKALIKRHCSALDWTVLGDSTNLNFDMDWLDIVPKTQRDVFVYRIGFNDSVAWTEDLFRHFLDVFRSTNKWCIMAQNSGLPWTSKLVNDYSKFWNWDLLSSNVGLPWSETFIDFYADKWCWHTLSKNPALPWSEQFIERFSNNWTWEALACNKGITWNSNLINEFWKRICGSPVWHKENDVFKTGAGFLPIYTKSWSNSWLGICNHAAATIGETDLLNQNAESLIITVDGTLSKNIRRQIFGKGRRSFYWDWDVFSSSVPWSADVIAKFEAKWKWRQLSGNRHLLWTADLIEKYSSQWCWYSLSENPSLPWSVDLIDRYSSKWIWGNISANEKLPWTHDLIVRYKDHLDFTALSGNPSIPWSNKLYSEYSGQLSLSKISDTQCFDFTSLNDGQIDRLLNDLL